MNFIEQFKLLPNETQNLILKEIYKALKWRGWDNHPLSILGTGAHSLEAINNIANLLWDRHQIEVEEHT